jgi:hypothetical protein
MLSAIYHKGCPKCRGSIANLRFSLNCWVAGRRVNEVVCICGYHGWHPVQVVHVTRVIAPIPKKQNGIVDSDVQQCTVKGCSETYIATNSRYLMCPEHSVIYRRWLDSERKGLCKQAPMLRINREWVLTDAGSVAVALPRKRRGR